MSGITNDLARFLKLGGKVVLAAKAIQYAVDMIGKMINHLFQFVAEPTLA